jgi:hypothetical protein
MDKNELPAIICIGILAVVALVVIGPSIGLGVAIAKGTATVPLMLREAIIVVAIGGGAVGATAGAVTTVSKISEKRRSAFIALCACGEWFLADAMSELYLAGHTEIEKILFKGSASLAFALAGGLWSTPRWPQRLIAAVLFLAPSLMVALKALTSKIDIRFQGYQLYLLLAVPALLAGLYITLFTLGYLREK